MSSREISYAISSTSDSTIVAQVVETRLMRKNKYFLAFDSFRGLLQYFEGHPERSRLTIDIDSQSVTCRDRSLRQSKQKQISEYVKDVALNARQHPVIQFSSYQISAKPLRGYAMEGVLTANGTTRPLKMNFVLARRSPERLEFDADTILRLSDFGIKAPSTLFGMFETGDQVLLHLHLYAIPEAPQA